jgi:hypothetical protein
MDKAQTYNEPAFPMTSQRDHEFLGLTMRDYFAAKAMQGELAAMHDPEGEVCGVALDAPDDTLARLARHYYRLADAMLVARAA